MNEHDKLSERDVETLNRVEALLSLPQPPPDGLTEMSVLLAHTVPQADSAFQNQLEAQLLERLDEKRAQKPQRDSPAASRNPRPATLSKHTRFAPRIPFNQAAGRLGSALVGAAMLVALVLALAFLLQMRRDSPNIANKGTATPTTTLTTAPAQAVTIKTGLLPQNIVPLYPNGHSWASGITWSPDGKTLASASPSGIITLWDTATGEKVREIDATSNGKLNGIAWSPTEHVLASYSTNEATFWGLVALWDTTTGKQLNSFTQDQGRVTSIAWSPDGKVLAWTDGWTVTRWDRTSGTALPKPQPTWPAPITTAGIESNTVTNLAWSPDGKRLATSQSDMVKVWDLTGGQELASLSPGASIAKIAWSSDGGSVLAALTSDQGSRTGLALWDAATNQRRQTPPIAGNISSISWLPHGLVLAISVLDDTNGNAYVSRYDTTTGELVRITDSTATELAWSPDNQTLAIANPTDGVITLLNGWGEPEPTPTAIGNRPTATTVAVGSPSTTTYPLADSGCWGIWNVSMRADTRIAGAKSGSVISLGDIFAIPTDHPDVWVVGSTRDSNALATTLTMHWDGWQWNVIPSPNKNEQFGYQGLNAVAALSSDNVWAVGDYTNSNAAPHETLIEHWDGKAWSIIQSPSPGGINSLAALDAASTNDIWAVGYTVAPTNSKMEALILHWDGHAWSVVPGPKVDTPNRLQSVVAISANDAWAVGWSHADSAGDAASIALGMPLAMHWDGTKWSTVPVPNIENGQLTGISASNIGDVWAIGYRAAGSTGTEAVVLHWDQTRWNAVDQPRLTVDRNYSAYQIKAFSAEDVWIAGTQVAHWDGRRWTIQANQSAQQIDAELRDVALYDISSAWGTELWALGSYGTNPRQPLVLHHSVSYPCTSMGTPVNVAPGADQTPTLTLFLTPVVPSPIATRNWQTVPVPVTVTPNGCEPRWEVVELPPKGAGDYYLADLAAISTNDIWAVGSTTYQNGESQTFDTLAMHWNGKEWTIVPTPNKGISHRLDALISVEALAPNNVWTVGYYAEVGGVPNETLILHWDGKGWTIVPAPSPGSYNTLVSISGVSASDVWAVGNTDNGLLTLHWNGQEWQVIPVLKVGKVYSTLNAVAAVAPNDVWAIGSYRDAPTTQGSPASQLQDATTCGP